MDMCLKHLLTVATGQGIEVYWRENNICPSEKQYMQMIRDSKSTDVS